jgi:hypothetical protein
MQPIKTTNAMNPAPAKGIQSLPTPVIDDVIITEVVNAWKGDYQKLEYGTMWDSVPHGSQQGSFPEHKLVFQQVSSEDGQWVKRIWANDRVNQDSYNYAIKYSSGSQEHPIYIRTYIVPRETYFPLQDLTPDDMFPNAFLTDEAVTRNEGTLDSKYITVTRVFETLPGPVVPSQRYNERGDLESISTQTVFPRTPPDPDGLLITRSQVVQEDVSKGVKTTSSVEKYSTLAIKERKEGLLGETTTTDDIVSPSTQPDDLSLSVVASVVQQTSATKAVKRTTTSSGPRKLATDTLIESQLGLVKANVEKSIVDADTDPTSDPNIGLLLVKDSINKLDNAKSEREFVKVNEWPENVNVDYDEQLGIGVYYKETIVSPNEYINPNYWDDLSNIDYKAIDQWKSLKKQIDINRVSQALLNQYYKIPTQVKMKLPDKLKSATCYLANSYGAGTDFNISQGANTGSYNMSNSGSSKSSWSIGGDIYFEIENGYDGYLEGFKHVFFVQMINGRISDSDSVINILNNFAQFGSRTIPEVPPGGVITLSETYQKWPYLRTKTENLVLITGGRSLSNSNSLSQSVGINGFASSTGEGKSFDVNVSANSITVPQTLHPAITININEVNSVKDTKGIKKPTISVNPSILPPTDPPQFVPGQYLIDADIELYKWGFVKVTAITATVTTSQI